MPRRRKVTFTPTPVPPSAPPPPEHRIISDIDPFDASYPSVECKTIQSSIWSGDKSSHLDLSRDNWPAWHRQMIDVLALSGGLDHYCLEKEGRPDPNREPNAYKNYVINNKAVCAFIRLKCAPVERAFISGQTSADVIWEMLKTRHVKQGPVAQALLIVKAFNIEFRHDTPLAETAHQLRELNNRIWDMGDLTPDVLYNAALLHAAGTHMPQLREQIIARMLATAEDRDHDL